jgi:peptide/nickel transport system substrate-binding protein
MGRIGQVVVAASLSLALVACSPVEEDEGAAPSEELQAGQARKGGELVLALAEEPDALDPSLARTFVGRIVFSSICEKL